MATYVPGYQHDIFVSYAHVDDQPILEEVDGWVTSLTKKLKNKLNQKLGRDAYELWKDEKLARNIKIDPQIMAAIKNTAILLVILSPAYTQSEWCQREKSTFLEYIRDRVRSGSRVFVVEYDKLEPVDRPHEFDGLLGYRFWVEEDGKPARTLGDPKPLAEEVEYWNRLGDLANDMAKELKRLKSEVGRHKKPAPSQDTGKRQPTVYLAEVTDDLDALRDEVKRHLDQEDIAVLPDTWYPRDPENFITSLERDLARCKVFVQLLGLTAGKKAPDVRQGYAHLQYEHAKENNKKILQWRDPGLAMNDVVDASHLDLLGGETVHAVRIHEFKEKVTKEALYEPPPDRPVRAFVFVNTDTNDKSIADMVLKVLNRYQADYVLPLPTGSPSEIREDLEVNLRDCDGVIIVYGNTTVNWVRQQLRQCRKAISRRKTPLKALAVFEGPPEKKVSLDLKIHPMQVIKCPDNLKESSLKSFIDALRKE